MIKQSVVIPSVDWLVDVYYDARPSDALFLMNRLRDVGCPPRHLHKAKSLLGSGIPNQGLTYSNERERHSMIVIGRASDCFEFYNSCNHERQHLEQAICRVFDLDPYGEEIAYISGEIAEAIARNAWMAMRKLFLYLI